MLRQGCGEAKRMMSARQDVQHLPVRDLPKAAPTVQLASRSSEAGPHAAERSPSRGAADRKSSGHLVSLRLHLTLLCALAAVVPTLTLIGIESAGLDDALGGLPSVSTWPAWIAVVAAAGFGSALGVIAARRLSVPLAALTRAVDALGGDAGQAPMPSTDVLEVTRLVEALTEL